MNLSFILAKEKIVENPYGIRIPLNPQALGEHIRKVRMERELFQKTVAQIIGVDEESITAWENGRNQPQVHFYPKILQFLECNPFNHDLDTVSNRLRQVRLCDGYSIKIFALIIAIDPGTLTKWEKGKGQLSIVVQNVISNYCDKLPQFLKISHCS